MTTLTLLDVWDRPLCEEDRPSILRRVDDCAPAGHGAPAAGAGALRRSGRTLDDLITGTWQDLAAGRSATCPVCAGPLEPRFGAATHPVAARCGDCGSALT